ncbi:hypothetical protein [Streptomyces sp. NBC_00989]|uniref:hypothetical protein n=1 Tax=Streptomyces sp. NBC_00989 TaxID=2903705 RepID=UPI0038660B74|nr:hypothetical protein OG714_04800 [Streptomyces sp. NBC_00989]
MDAGLAALRSDEPELPDVDEKIRRFIALAREVHRAAEVVILEGPVSIVNFTERVADASSGLSEVMRRMANDARARDVTRKAEDVTLAAERERILYQEVRAFRVAARGVIGNAA